MGKEKCILRYENITTVTSPLDPIDDISAWITGLNSINYTSDLLISFHKFKKGPTTKRAAEIISTYSENALAFLDQAYSGPPDHSYLPLYYAILNLSKIYIVTSGFGKQLDTNRWHGASYNPQSKISRDLLTERITLKPGGVFPIFYQVLTSHKWSYGDKSIELRDIFPFIRGISHEFDHAYKIQSPFQLIKICCEGDLKTGYRLSALTYNKTHPNANNLRYLKVITGFHPDTSTPNKYYTKYIQESSEELAKVKLLKSVRRFLFYDSLYSQFGELMGGITPITNCQLLLPEEIPIWIAFYYLSNIVRYNPEYLEKLMDSKAWPILLTLRKHAIFTFLKLFWSFMQKSEYRIIYK